MLCLVTQSCPALCNLMDCSLPSSSVHRDSPGKNTGVGCHESPQPRDQPRSSALQADFFYHLSHHGKPKNTGVGSLSLLQGIFPTQESNQGLLHCRRILYQLSYQGSTQRADIRANKHESQGHRIMLGMVLKMMF